MSLLFIDKELLVKNIEVIKRSIEIMPNITDSGRLLNYLSDLSALQALATETQASAKYHKMEAIKAELDKQLRYEIKDEKSKNIAPSIAKLRAESNVAEWVGLCDYTERLSHNISHSIDAVRTKLSFLKNELNYNR